LTNKKREAKAVEIPNHDFVWLVTKFK